MRFLLDALLANHLIGMCNIELMIFVPPHYGHYTVVEEFEVLKFLLNLFNSAKSDDLFAYSWVHVNFSVGSDVYLLQLLIPEGAVVDVFCQFYQILFGINAINMPCCYEEVTFVIQCRQAKPRFVQVKRLSGVGKDTHDGDALRHKDIDVSAWCFVTHHLADIRIFEQGALNRFAVDAVHHLSDGINICLLDGMKDFIFLYKATVLIGNLHVDCHTGVFITLSRQVHERIDKVTGEYQNGDEAKDYFKNFEHCRCMLLGFERLNNGIVS